VVSDGRFLCKEEEKTSVWVIPYDAVSVMISVVDKARNLTRPGQVFLGDQ